MVQFRYLKELEMPPRPGRKYSTTYIKQTQQEHDRLKSWLVEIAETIIDICQHDPQVAEWFSRPMPDFHRSQRNEYYSPQDLLTDMIDQLIHGRDITQAMIGRWNRLTESTPWQIEFAKV